MSNNEIAVLCNKFASNAKGAHRNLYICGKKDSYVLKKDAVKMLKSYNKIMRDYGCAVTAYVHEKQFTSNQEDWVHEKDCLLYSPNWVRPAGQSFVEHDDCWCDISGLFVDFDIKQLDSEKVVTQELVNKIAFEVTKLLYTILARVEDEAQLVGPVTGYPAKTLKEVRDTIVCYSSHRANIGRGGALKGFDADYYKEGIHLMYPGLMLQRDTKRRIIAYLRGVAKDPGSDLFRLLESKIPNKFPELVEGCYQYIDPVAATNMTIPYGSVKFSAGKAPSPCNYLNQTCNYFVFTSRDLDKDSAKLKKIFDFNKAAMSDRIHLDALERRDTVAYMFNFTTTQLEKAYPGFNITLELSLVYKEFDSDGDPTGFVDQVRFRIPDEVKNSDEFIGYTVEYKEKSFAVAEDIKTRRENKEALEIFEKNHIGYSDEVSEALESSPMQQVYNIVASLSRKRSSEYQTWYEVLIKVKQIAGFYKRDIDGYTIGMHFSKRHCRKRARNSEEIDESYYDEGSYIRLWNSLAITVTEDGSVPINVYYSNFYSLLSLVKADNLEDYVSFCDSDFMENLSKYIITKKVSPNACIPELQTDYKINPVELADIINRYIRPFYKSGMLHGRKHWAEFDSAKVRWTVFESSQHQRIPVGIEGFVTKFIIDLVNNVSKKYLRCFDTQVGILFQRLLPSVKTKVKVVSSRIGAENDVGDDSDVEDDNDAAGTNDAKSIARVVGSTNGPGDDGDLDIDEDVLSGEEETGGGGTVPGSGDALGGGATLGNGATRGATRGARKGKAAEELVVPIGTLARHFRTYVIGKIGGKTFISPLERSTFTSLQRVFEDVSRKLMITVSPEISSNYYSYLTSVKTYQELTNDPTRYLKNMEARLFSDLVDQEFFETKDTARLFIGVKNGVLELRHFEYPILHKGYHTFPVTMQMGCKYKQFDPTDKYVLKVLKAMKSMFIDAEHDAFDYLMRSSCVALDLSVHDTTYDFCYGGGSNGKSSYTGMMSKTFGEYYADMSVALITYGLNRKQAGQASPELLKLENKRFVLIAEANNIILDDNILKKITSNENLEGRALHSNNDRSFSVKPKVSITLNQIPGERADDEGSRRRKMVIPFTRGFKKAGVKITDPSHIRADPEILGYCEDENYRTAFLSILTFYYAHTTGLCHERYFRNLRGKANEIAKAGGGDAEAIFREFVDEYKHKPQDTFHIEVRGTGLPFPTVENATNQFQKKASPAYKFLSDRVFTFVNMETPAAKARPIVEPSVELSKEYQALPNRPKLSDDELVKYRGVISTTAGVNEFYVEVPDGLGNTFAFTPGKGDNYKVELVEEKDGEENLDSPDFPFSSFEKRYVDLDYIIEQYCTYNMVGGRQREVTEGIKQGFATILNPFAVKNSDDRFEILFVNNEDYRKLSRIGNIVKQSHGAIKPLENDGTATGIEVSFGTYIEEVTKTHKKLLRGADDKTSAADNTVECSVSHFGYSNLEKKKAAPLVAKRKVFNSINRVSGFADITL